MRKKIIFFLGLQNKVGATDQPRSIPLWLRQLHGGIPLAPVASDSAIHRINHYPADSVIDFRNTYPLDSDLSSG